MVIRPLTDTFKYTTITHVVGSCLATKVFVDDLPAMGRGWVIIK